MAMRFVRLSALASAATASVLMLSTAPADAGPPFAVSAGSAPISTVVKYTGTTTSAGAPVFTDVPSGATIMCVSGTIKGTVTTATGLPTGAIVAKIAGAQATFTQCTGLGVLFKVTGSATWNAKVAFGTLPSVGGKIFNVQLQFTNPSCSFTVTGSMPYKYFNTGPPPLLKLNGTTSNTGLAVTAGACAPFNPGDAVVFNAVYQIVATNPSFDPINITG